MRAETGYKVEDPTREDGVLCLVPPDQTEYVLKVKDRCEMELVGGKAFNISRLAREGFTVPKGFCVTTKAYDCFADFNNISVEDENVSEKIREGLMPPLLSEVIRDAYHTYLGSRSCAVRSSSPFEDLKSASFAGQYKSFLNVKGEEALLSAVKECWASLWSQGVIEYRKKMGIENENIKMAVLVQEMIPAEASGVLFIEEKMVIEAVWGLGDILVGGEVIPDHFVVEEEFRVRERKISHKDVMSQISSTGGVEVTEVPEHLRDSPVLEDVHLQQLSSLGRDVKDLFGCPQDIEWAICDDKFVILQARPITVKQTPTVLSRANVAENQPGYVTYLSRTPENQPDFLVLGIRPFLECFGIKDIPEDMRLAEYAYGHLYVNMTTAYSVVGKIPGFSPEMLDKSVGHFVEEKAPESKLGLYEIVKLLPGAFRVIRLFLNLPTQAEQVIPHSVELIENIKHRNLQEMNIEELDHLVWEMYERTLQVLAVHECGLLAIMALFDILNKILKKMEEEDAENLLTMGLEGMSSRLIGVEMWKLAQNAMKSSRVVAVIHSRREDVLEELNQFQEGKDFLKDLDRFIEKYGDRCSQELELSIPRWGENPDFVLSMIANYLDSGASDPSKTIEEQKRIRCEATDRILKELSKNPFEKIFFKKMLEKTQEFIVTREDLKTTWVRGIFAMRIVYLAIAEKLVGEGILESREDIFHLKMTEVSDIIGGNLKKKQLEDFIEERKKEKEVYEHLEVPMVIIGEPPPIEELECTVESKDILEGMGVSHGVIKGRARVVLDPRECSEFKEGEILVAPITDPGWTPLFVTAGGLVMELGGALSHGVIIAREYGIPAVVAVKNATKIIKTGQLVTVDGTRGLVSIRGDIDEGED